MTGDEDKIASIKFRLLSGFHASKLMQATIFCGPQDRIDYEIFVTNFVETFDQEGETKVVESVIHTVESIQ